MRKLHVILTLKSKLHRSNVRNCELRETGTRKLCVNYAITPGFNANNARNCDLRVHNTRNSKLQVIASHLRC